MTDSSYGAQVVEVKDHRFLLDEKKLEEILMREEIRDLPVMVVSVAGAYRGGKSFLLNFFLRYLKSMQSNRNDGTWLDEGRESLEGFSWKSGSTRNTTGILMSEPIICTLPTGHEAGNKIAVVLMDTQGTFDSSSTVNECSTIFAISTLLSSVQIYNISNNIQEDHLQHLQLFTEYGKLVLDRGNEKPFQVLQFLVRDWPYEWEHPYGYTGGEALLQERLKIDPGMSKELQGVRTHIRSCFEKVFCFLMPHPGKQVSRPDFRGKISEIHKDFVEYLKVLVPSIFSQEELKPKTINGDIVKARDLFTYFKSYMDMFSSGDVPPTENIMQVTVKALHMTAVREGLAQYEEKMEQDCGEETKCVPVVDIKVLHDRHKADAMTTFKKRKKMGSNKMTKPYYVMLSKDINKKLKQFTSINAVKQQKVTEAASKAYNNETLKYSQDGILCVHTKDLDVIHKEASEIALTTFNAGRKRVTDKTDFEENNFEKHLMDEFQLLRATNDSNNKQVIADLREVYWRHMESTTTGYRVAKSKLQKAHDEGVLKVLEMFKKRRSLTDIYDEDAYKDQLIKTLENRYNHIKTINELANKKAMNAAVVVYNKHITSVWDQQNQTLHPDDLKQDHETAKQLAWDFFRERYDADISTEDEVALENILTQRYDELLEKNAAMNTKAIQSGHIAYKTSLEKLSTVDLWLLALKALETILPESLDLRFLFVKQSTNIIIYILNLFTNKHNSSKENAKIEFYRVRRDNGPEFTDIYLQELLEAIEKNRPTKSFCRSLLNV